MRLIQTNRFNVAATTKQMQNQYVPRERKTTRVKILGHQRLNVALLDSQADGGAVVLSTGFVVGRPGFNYPFRFEPQSLIVASTHA